MYKDINGIEHESYADACRYYGADTPEQFAAEIAAEAREYEAWAAAHPAEAAAAQARLKATIDDCPF